MNQLAEYREAVENQRLARESLKEARQKEATSKMWCEQAERNLELLKIHIPSHYALLLLYLSQRHELSEEQGEVVFTLTAEQMECRFVAFVLRLCEEYRRLYQDTKYDIMVTKVRRLYEERANGRGYTEEPWLVDVPLLNYVNTLTVPEAQRDAVRSLAAFSKCLDKNWGDEWLLHGLRDAESHFPHYARILAEEIPLLLAHGK